MEEQSTAEIIAGFIPITFLSLCCSILFYKVAKKLGENRAVYTLLGFVPLVNVFAAFYLLGSGLAKVVRKLDRAIALVEGQGSDTVNA